jgi:4-methylaminobutanoate oxidase (formaldehyde-forming)
MAQDQSVVVVGGGIWGFSTAFHLAKLGVAEICVIEQNAEAADETTSRAAGLVGQIRSSPVMCNAIGYALDLLSRLEDETGHDPGLRRTGSLLVAMTPRRMEAYRAQVQHARDNGVEADFVSHAEIQRLAPAIDVSRLEGGYFVPGDGYVDPRQCALALAAAARDLGVDVRFSTRASGLKVEGGRVSGVETDRGVVGADHVVVTAGPWTGMLARHAGLDLPMQTIRHQRARTVPAEGIPGHHPVVRVTDESCYLRPEQGGYLYGFFEPAPTAIDLEAEPPEFRTADLEVPYDTIGEARRRLAQVFPVLATLEVAEYRQGITTFAPDGQYLTGPLLGVEGLFVASGCAALGIAGAAAVGRWLAESIVNGQVHPSLAQFNHRRFGERANDPAWVQRTSLRFYANYYGIAPGTPE